MSITIDRDAMMDPKLKDLRKKIQKEVPYVDIKPYSHNIINVVLRQIAKEFGKDVANKTIDDFSLVKLGWRKEK